MVAAYASNVTHGAEPSMTRIAAITVVERQQPAGGAAMVRDARRGNGPGGRM